MVCHLLRRIGLATSLGSCWANHNNLFSMRRVLYNDWQRSISVPDLKKSRNMFQIGCSERCFSVLFSCKMRKSCFSCLNMNQALLQLACDAELFSFVCCLSTCVLNQKWTEKFKTNLHLQKCLCSSEAKSSSDDSWVLRFLKYFLNVPKQF